MRTLGLGLLAILATGCVAGTPRVPEITIGHGGGSALWRETSSSSPRSASRCVIRGDGEAERYETPPFPLFARSGDAEPIAIVARVESVHVAWTHFPPSDARGSYARARVDLGGQSLVRMTAWSPLAQRVFHIHRRADVAKDHVWVRGGHEVRLVGADGPDLVVEVDTELEEPKTMRAHTSCENVAYVVGALPEVPDDGAPVGGEGVAPTGSRLDLFGGPSGEPIARLAVPDIGLAGIVRLESRGERARVAFEHGGIAFDAWVPAGQLTAVGAFGSGGRGGWGRSRCGGGGRRKMAKALRDADLWIGASHAEGKPIGQLERGAPVFVQGEADGRSEVVLRGAEIVAREGISFYVRTADLEAE